MQMGAGLVVTVASECHETADFEGTNHLSVVVLLADYDKGELEERQSTCLHHLEMSRIGDLACPNRYVDANSDSI